VSNPVASVVIPSHKRNNLLRWNLHSLFSQDLRGVEVIVLDESFEADDVCLSIAREHGCRYMHTGSTKDGDHWRIPGFAINIAAKQAEGDSLVICCAEVYHVGKTIAPLIELSNADTVVVPRVIGDDKGGIITFLNGGFPIPTNSLRRLKPLNTRLPFFMSCSREVFLSIGGYDEDFTGVCWDDNDIADRLVTGRQYAVADIELVHLFHQRHDYKSPDIKERWDHNKAIYDSRRGTIVRNVGRKWGTLPETEQ
jgi:glycosyltransferase involved in cell wall biosynthesis